MGLCLAPIRPVVCTRQDVDQDQANAKSTRVAHAFADIRLVVWSSARLAQMGARSADCDLPSWAERNGDRDGMWASKALGRTMTMGFGNERMSLVHGEPTVTMDERQR